MPFIPSVFLSRFLFLVIPGAFLQSVCYAQSPFQGLGQLFTTPKNYQALFVNKQPVIDGNLRDAVWESAPWSADFTDIEGDTKPQPALQTRVKMLWNDTCLFIAAELKDPHVWATLKKHDEVVFFDNDFEVFIDPDNNTHQYYEIEVNALNTIFDLFMPKPYRNGSGAMIPYDTPGMRTAVKINGTLNNPADTDQGWTVEMCIPFRALTIGNDTHVPAQGEIWRINFSRVEWDMEILQGKYSKKKGPNGRSLPEHNWVWSPQGVVNMHYPERWGYLQFIKSGEQLAFSLPYSEKQKQYLWLIYYREKAYFAKNGRYASLAELGVEMTEPIIEDKPNKITLEATMKQFMATIISGNSAWSLNDEGLIQSIRPTR